ncbi:MAG: type II secretion system protein [Planctomycetota bacterium]|jgi:prepilin-type N-terminal cleavage/methylation domain-containing protein/prepilin-type processing-associated H-X9-DG protein
MLLERTNRRANNTSTTSAFTLVELLIVLTALGLLATIVVPTFTRAVELARSAICKHKMSQMSSAMWALGGEEEHVRAYGGLRVPDHVRWDDLLFWEGLFDLTICPSDRIVLTDPLEGLKELYVHQVSWQAGWEEHFDTNVYDILNGGDIEDDQFIAVYGGATYAGGAPICDADTLLGPMGGVLKDNQLAMAMGHSTVLMTITDNYVKVEEFIRNPDWWDEYGHLTGSDHFLCRGPGDDWTAEKVRDLTGRNYKMPAEGYANIYQISYGMNSLVASISPNQNQIWLIEYTDRDVFLHDAPLDQPFDDNAANGEVMARHLGRANTLFVDGGVRSMTKADVQAEYDDPDGAFHP